jgi:hypothetical protein
VVSIRRLSDVKGSDSHNVNEELGKLKDHQSNPTNKYCWIKADPTFDGLRQIVNEPEDRVYIGRIPPKLEEVLGNPTRYMNDVQIRSINDPGTDDGWFNSSVPLNFDMVAIIGNKGSGKSALADVLALAGNTHCDPKYFSFLNKERFCERNGRLSKQFEVGLVWRDGTPKTVSLNAKPDLNDVELVKYIPQAYLEKVCTETEPGQQSEFQRELRKVIFSHIDDDHKLGKASLDDLIEYRTAEVREQQRANHTEIARLNVELVRLEQKATIDYAAQLEGKSKLKRQELDAHDALKPAAVAVPATLSPEAQASQTEAERKLSDTQTELTGLETQIEAQSTKRRTLVEQLTLATKLEGKLDNLAGELARIDRECALDCTKLSLQFADLVTVTINKTPLLERRDALVSEKAGVEASLSAADETSLVSRKTTCEARIRTLQEQLDAPQKAYQAFLETLKIWQVKRDAIEGDGEKADTLRGYEAQLKYVKELLPGEIAEHEKARRKMAASVHACIVSIKEVYRELFGPVQELIEVSVIIREGFRLTFQSQIVERALQQDLFDKYINQGVVGSFCGKEKGAAVLEELRGDSDFNDADSAIAFVESLVVHLRADMRTTQRPSMNIAAQLRKHVDVGQLYDYLWTFPYLTPEYSLTLDGKDLSHLSPGERGTLLLVFYLLVDKSRYPIIVDQPEENLDSQTVYRLLIPVIKEVKRRRQIIMVTHSPNIAVVCDAEQIIHAAIDRSDRNRVVYTMGAIESPELNKHLVDVLEGTRPAFDNRESKYLAS